MSDKIAIYEAVKVAVKFVAWEKFALSVFKKA